MASDVYIGELTVDRPVLSCPPAQAVAPEPEPSQENCKGGLAVALCAAGLAIAIAKI